MNDFERRKKTVLAPIYFEAGAALFDCQYLEYGIAYLLYLLSRLGVTALDPNRCRAIMDDDEKKTAGQLIALLKEHAQVSDDAEEELLQALRARNKLIHRFFTDNTERMVDVREHEKLVKEIRSLRSTVQRSQKRFQPLVENLMRNIDGVDATEFTTKAKWQFMQDTTEH